MRRVRGRGLSDCRLLVLSLLTMATHLWYLYMSLSYAEEVKGHTEASDQFSFLLKMSTIHRAQKGLTADLVFAAIFFAVAAFRDTGAHAVTWILLSPLISLGGEWRVV